MITDGSSTTPSVIMQFVNAPVGISGLHPAPCRAGGTLGA